MNFSSNKHRNSFKVLMKHLAKKRSGIQQLRNKLREKAEEKPDEYYETDNKIKEVVQEAIESENIPVEKVMDTGLIERTDIEYAKRKEVAA